MCRLKRCNDLRIKRHLYLNNDRETNLLWVSTLLAVVLDEVHQAVHHCLHCHQTFFKLLPSWRRGICGTNKYYMKIKHYPSNVTMYRI